MMNKEAFDSFFLHYIQFVQIEIDLFRENYSILRFLEMLRIETVVCELSLAYSRNIFE